ncbi:D-glycero-beta-D-manno-heptose 1,7-bisphosphate 7-phosphatase [Marinomonas algicola]|uniref:D-glycero-beta-D-manno-heptose 1,7-bisphosphate 7-phosphatase n=1 Tax=Marinomonas algicola TaxID=2773454 RepID=UPI00174E082F|nr:D-glycero-beta-D-manno-heptose 1,7-bisphosphate 7-phosphatase [Marinomonas algicola]
MPNKKPIIILDRDGVINYDSDQYVKTLDEWQPIPGSIKAIAALSKAGFHVYIATNQSGVARGYYTLEILEQMHQKMIRLIEAEGGKIAGIQYCPHGPDDDCHCRKPKPGMIDAIEKELGVNFNSVPAIMVGDSKRDLEAGIARGCQAALVLTGKGRDTQYKEMNFHFNVFTDLAAFTLDTLFKYQ